MPTKIFLDYLLLVLSQEKPIESKFPTPAKILAAFVAKKPEPPNDALHCHRVQAQLFSFIVMPQIDNK